MKGRAFGAGGSCAGAGEEDEVVVASFQCRSESM